MKTKFILHGGFSITATDQENDAFFAEVLSSAPQTAKILLVYFAASPDSIEKYIASDTKQFEKNKGEKILSFEVARIESFTEQVKASEIIYLHGGHSSQLLNSLKPFSDLKQLFQGKIVGADSAGVNVLSSAFYSKTMGVAEGLCVIPIKVICHYREENRDKLEQIHPELETLFLSEYQFKVI